ncbi:Phosphate-specific outer membrane porin OprP [uncultured Defluviicoccus sp.]|uniref:Phosphate-specific outer membrane porin OprP n=1 Tax=metagenome TaxID=256318 RepID=A0A380T799_9ZZZZ|nr:Phosphate-specific outer membrane porin OprP [uncultured Defluviicoccus sp.]
MSGLLARSVSLAAIALAATGAAWAQDTKKDAPKEAPKASTTLSGGAAKTTEGDASFKINGRVQYDVFNVSTDGAAAVDQDYSRAFVRRAFLGVEGQFTKEWRYNIKLAFQPGADQASASTTTVRLCQNSTTSVIAQRSICLGGEADRGPVVIAVSASGADTEVGFDDAYIQYVTGPWEIVLGQNSLVAPMEERTSSLNTPFNERSGMVNAFGFTKTMGVAVGTSGDNWSAAAGVYGDDLNNPESTNTSETISLQARGAWAPIYSQSADGITLLHLGLNARYRDNAGGPDATGIRGPGFRYRARPETGFGDRFVDTGSVAYAQDAFLGAEFAAQHNGFSLAGEYGQLSAKPQSGATLTSDSSFTGGYLDLMWSPTGDNRYYKVKHGAFGNVTPHHMLGADGFGAVTLGLRYDFLDLTDGAMDGGQQKGFTLQSTWQPLSFLKFQIDYSRLDIDRPASPLSGTADVITMRSQIEW